MINQNNLYHTGVLGMKWGHHKTNNSSALKNLGKAMSSANEWSNRRILSKQEKKGPINKNYSKEDRLADQQIHGTRGVRQISKRMDKGQSHTKASLTQTGKEMVQTTALTALTLDVLSGGRFHKAGMSAVSKIMKSEMARKSVVKIAQNPKFDPIDVAFKILD